MNVQRRQFALGLVGTMGTSLAGGCSVLGIHSANPETDPNTLKPSFRALRAIPRLKISEDRLIRITVCTRPFRAAGPRLEPEMFGEKRVVHNYGHGGSGWSLSWGCAAEATALARAGGVRDIAIIGAGVIGLTTAIKLVETGARVTLYARDFPAESRSARATGVWSPSSRIALANVAAPDFTPRWERWARAGYATHQRYIGVAGAPVEFVMQYALADEQALPRRPASRDFLRLGRLLRDVQPRWSRLSETQHPFPVPRARGGLMMAFNVAAYSQMLTRDFLLRGGRMIRRSFADRSEILSLEEPVIVNCTGYDAKRLWGDNLLEPVRGQINWLAPQPNAQFGVSYRNVFAVSRRDGVVVQNVGYNDDFGFGDASEIANREEMQNTLRTLSAVFG